MIVRAASIYATGDLVEGYDYCKISYIAKNIGLNCDKIDGFVTSYGDFVLPDDAAKIALESGQIKEPTKTLNPEDLWPFFTL